MRPAPACGRRLAAACFALALTLSPVSLRTADAQAVKGEVSAVIEKGFARLLFVTSEEVESQVRLTNNILIITFQRPVEINVERLSAAAQDYVSVARRDPDGKGIRIALARKVTMNSMEAGEKLFIDLLPETWVGGPPGLPREVIEELARRAREAEKKAKQQRTLASQKHMAPIRVRALHQP